jgi:hypothetical protein
MDEKQIEALFSTRREYREDCQREKFHMDAYAGTGGFSGAIKATASSFWGWAADAYSESPWFLGITDHQHSWDTYLDRFDREDLSKFERRRQVVHYENHVEPCVDIPLSYLRRKPLTRENAEGLEDWMEDATSDDQTWNDLVMGDVLLRGTVTGMCPVMFDLDPGTGADPETGAARTKADDIAQGRRVRAIPLFGLNLLDYGESDQGTIEWAKIRFDFCDRPAGPLGPSVRRAEIRVLEKHETTLYRFELKDNGKRELTGTQTFKNPFGDVIPLSIFRPKPMPGDPVRGIALVQNIASESRRLFNLHSELDEHIRKTVFAFLQVPTTNPAQVARIVAGSGAALSIDPESKQPYAWIAPGQEVAIVLEKRIENTIAAIYAMMRLAFVRGQIVSAAASGISRQYEFESTNRSVSDIAAQLAKFDERSLNIVARVEAPNGEKVRTSAAADYGIEDLDRELATAETATRARLGSKVLTILRERLAAKLTPNVAPADMEIIRGEILAMAESELRAQMQVDALSDMGGAFPGGDAPTSETVVETEGETEGETLEGVPAAGDVEAQVDAAAQVEGATVQVQGLAKDPSKALNGAQIDSLLKIVEQVTAGTLPKESAIAIILVAFPMTEVDAKAILDPIPPPPEKPVAPPAGQAPPFTSRAGVPPDPERDAENALALAAT